MHETHVILLCVLLTSSLGEQAVPGPESTTSTNELNSTSSPVTVLTTPAPTIAVEIDGPHNVTLPLDSVSLSVKVEDYSKDELTYHWEALQGAGLASAPSYNKEILELSDLKPGLLLFAVEVSNGSASGRAQHSLYVAEHVNEKDPPKAIILPHGPIDIVEGSVLTLNAEGSSVQALPATYQWTQVSGPSVTLPATNLPSLKIEKLTTGEYEFSVDVRDAYGRVDSAAVNVSVHEERDDPPKARITQAGSNDATSTITVRLPIEELKLFANGSTDDKGIVSYRWFRVDELIQRLAVDLEGSTTDVLTLRNLQANEHLGAYEFQLDVLDEKKQKDSARVSVFVNVAKNMAPVADAGGNRTLVLPETSFVLEGNAKDDGSIVSYVWTQESGPTTANILNPRQAKTTVSNLAEGVYQFSLAVVDDGGLNDTDTTWISVVRGLNTPPVAVAANVSVTLPASVATLDGTSSHDDAGITVYRWTPADTVPACIHILGNSDRKPVLLLGGLIEGTFRFNFTVKDQQGERDETWVALHVEAGEAERESIEIYLQQSLAEYSHLDREKLENRISAVLSSNSEDSSDIVVHTSRISEVPTNGRLRLVMWAEGLKAVSETTNMRRGISPSSSTVLKAENVIEVLRTESTMLRDFHIVSMDTLYCKLQCSGHGSCSDFTKECSCDKFWMTSLLTLLLHGGRHIDCAWSSVYFAIFTILVLLVSVIYVFRRRGPSFFRTRTRRVRRRRRYSPLHSDDSDGENGERRSSKPVRHRPRLQPLPLPPSSDTLNSESDDLLPKGISVGGWQNIELMDR